MLDGGESSCFITPRGGVISLTGDPPRIAGIERITTTPTGVAFGPLKCAVPDLTDEDEEDSDTDHTVAAIENLRFAPDEDSSATDDDDDGWFGSDDDSGGFLGFALAGGIAGASGKGEGPDTDQSDVRLTRRQTIGVTAAVLATGGMAATTRAEADQIKFAEFDLVRSDGPVWVGILDLVDNALPADTEVHLDVDGGRRASWTPTDAADSQSDPNGETIVLGDDDPAHVTVYVEGGVGGITSLSAWASGVLAAEKEIQATLSLPAPADTFEEGDELELTTHPAFVEPARDADGGESVVQIDDVSIPHMDERRGHDRGSYGVEDDALVYVVGPDPPSGQLVELRLRAGRIASITDSIDRL